MSLSSVFAIFYLPVYSLPFNIMVLLFLYVLKFRIRNGNNLHTVFYQYNSPEKNLYAFRNASERFARSPAVKIKLPFFGEWTVTQAYNGEHTHKGEWRHALDFEIFDDQGRSFRGEGDECSDYYCYDKAVLAPADGTVEDINDGIEDNQIGQVDLLNNWGNTIIIKHGEGLYSKLSHLKSKSITVKRGEQVKQGQIIARCGNSGRSPVPHLHLQLQATPYIGSQTIDYPFSHYILKGKNGFAFRSFDVPGNGDRVRNIESNPLLKNAFNLVPGQRIRINETVRNTESQISWQVQTSIYNKSYLSCDKTGSRAWFENDGAIWYFTHFEGDRSSLLYYFYLAAFKVQQGFYRDISLEDEYPVNITFPRAILFFQDFIAPFYIFLKARYTISYACTDNPASPDIIRLNSVAESTCLGRLWGQINFEMEIDRGGIRKLSVGLPRLKRYATWEG